MAFRWLPNIADFFFSLARLIEDSERQLNSASYDSLKFLVRRLDEYERTLATLTSRFCETYGCVPAQQNTVADLAYLCNRVAFLRSHFQRSIDCDDNSVVVSTPGNIRCYYSSAVVRSFQYLWSAVVTILLRTRASCRHVLVYHMCDLGLQSM